MGHLVVQENIYWKASSRALQSLEINIHANNNNKKKIKNDGRWLGEIYNQMLCNVEHSRSYKI